MRAKSKYIRSHCHSYVQVFVPIEIYNLGRLLYGVEGMTSKFKMLMMVGSVLINVIPT
jgi:hypothetical protein